MPNERRPYSDPLHLHDKVWVDLHRRRGGTCPLEATRLYKLVPPPTWEWERDLYIVEGGLDVGHLTSCGHTSWWVQGLPLKILLGTSSCRPISSYFWKPSPSKLGSPLLDHSTPWQTCRWVDLLLCSMSQVNLMSTVVAPWQPLADLGLWTPSFVNCKKTRQHQATEPNPFD